MKDKPLNRDNIKALPPSPASSKKLIRWDRDIKGLGAYRTSRGYVSFVFQYRMPGGKTKSIKLGNFGELTLEQARLVASEMALQRRQGTDPIALAKARRAEEIANTELVLANYAEGYIARREAGGKPLNKAQTNIVRNDVIGLLGEHRIDRMTVEDVEAFANTLAARGPSARRSGLTYLKAIMNEAISRDKIGRSVAAGVETNKSGERDRRFRDGELQRFLEAANDIGDCRGDIYEVLARTLKRKEEISRIQWGDLDLAKGEWHLDRMRNKGRESHRIELPRQVMTIILRQQPDPRLRVGPVFTLDGGRTAPEMGSQVKDLLDANMHRRLELANERDGTAHSIGHFTIHDLRTTGASRLQEKPFLTKEAIIDSILLHKAPGTVSRIYQRSMLEIEAGEVLQAWNDWVDALMARPDAWPGGRDLPPLTNAERKAGIARFREGWPLRADQRRAAERREAEGEKPKRSGRNRAADRSAD